MPPSLGQTAARDDGQQDNKNAEIPPIAAAPHRVDELSRHLTLFRQPGYQPRATFNVERSTLHGGKARSFAPPAYAGFAFIENVNELNNA